MKNADIRNYVKSQGLKVLNLEFVIAVNDEEEYIVTVEDESSSATRYIGVMTNGKDIKKSFWISNKEHKEFSKGFLTISSISETSDEIF